MQIRQFFTLNFRFLDKFVENKTVTLKKHLIRRINN